MSEPERPTWRRDPQRIPMILRAVEREWSKRPDTRLGQLLVNLLRVNTDTPTEEEGRRLFNIEDGQLLRWLGPQTEDEQTYIEEEPRRAREGWRAWERDHHARRDEMPDE
jgi:hypothetical protein